MVDVFGAEHQENLKQLNQMCDGLISHSQFIKNYAKSADLGVVKHFLGLLTYRVNETMQKVEEIQTTLMTEVEQ